MSVRAIQGVYSAVLTPRCVDGALEAASLRTLIAFLRSRGIDQFAVNGATGEFCLVKPDELREILSIVREEAGDHARIFCGVGAAGLADTQALVQVAVAAQVQGLLLSMPYFFPYSQDDLYEFCAAVAKGTSLPILLYNLPQFTSGLEVDTVCRLLEAVPNIAGVKDSSGSLVIMQALTDLYPKSCRIIGNDSALGPALRMHLCDGVISGVACALPELVSRFFYGDTATAEFQRDQLQLDEFIEQLNMFPTPWGLKLAAQSRGVLQASFSLPFSKQRARQSQQFDQWLQSWLPRAVA